MKLSLMLFTIVLFASTQMAKAQFNRSKGENTQQEPATPITSNNTQQEDTKGFSKDKLIYGGNLGLAFGSTTYIETTPILGYKFHKRIGAGLSGNYVFSRYVWFDQYTGLKQSQTYQVYGGGVWARVYLFENLFALSEFQMNKISMSQAVVNNSYEIKSQWYQSLLVGAGYRQRITDRVSMNLILMYDVLQQYPLYQNQPILKGGIIIGI